MEYVYIYTKSKQLFKANKPSEEYDLSKFKFKINELTDGNTVKIANKEVTVFKSGEWSIVEEAGNINGLKENWALGSIVRQGGTAAEFLSKYLINRKDPKLQYQIELRTIFSIKMEEMNFKTNIFKGYFT